MVERFYRFLLWLCPTDFRNEYGGEMARLFRDRRRREGTLAVLFEAVPDLILTAWREQMETLRRDLVQAVRMLIKNRGFAAAAILSLAVGIGATTAIFSVVNQVLIEPLPYREPGRLVRVYEKRLKQGRVRNAVSGPDYLDWQAQNTVFESMACLDGTLFTIAGDPEPELVRGSTVSPGFFKMLGITPRLGRDFSPGEDTPGKNRVALLSYQLWQRRFGGDPTVVGRSIRLSGNPYTVVGVLPEIALTIRAEAPQLDPDIWTPHVMTADYVRAFHNFIVFARLKPGVSLAQARSDMDAVSARLEAQFPGENTGHGVNLFPVTDELVGGVRPALLILFGAVGLVLLVACANVANLLLSRTVARRREISIRTAIGAGAGRLVRQLMTESLLLSLLGGAAGTLLAVAGVKALIAADPGNIPRLSHVRLDGTVLAFTLGITALTALLVGIASALYGVRTGLGEALRGAGRGALGGARQSGRSLLVVGEIALALMLAIGAGLMMQSFERLTGVHPGYDVSGVLAADIPLTGARYNRREDAVTFYRELLRRLEAQPGVVSVGATTALPLTGFDPGYNFSIEGKPELAYSQLPNARFRVISPGYFETMRIALRAGRPISKADTAQSTPVIAINETFARQHFPGESPVGKRIALADRVQVWREIVSVVADVKHTALDGETRPELFMPYPQFPQYSMSIVLRSRSAPEALSALVRREVAAIDREQPIRTIRTGEGLLATSVAQPRFYSMLLAVFSAVALALAGIGVYGVMSFAVGQRTKEMGLRMALGARSGAVIGMVVKQGLRLTAAGVVVGLAGAFAVMRVLGKLLYGIAPNDGATFAGAALLLTAVAAAACYIPARRAARADPIAALRCD
jgi:putative ABC transport system permease protein